MRPGDPLPRLLRLHGMASRASPNAKASLDFSDASGLTESYTALRKSTRDLAADLQISLDEFDQELPELEPAETMGHPDPGTMMRLSSHAATAATRLRSLRGYLEGLITMSVLTEDLSAEQIELVRRAVSD